jgi:hypothetical protein
MIMASSIPKGYRLHVFLDYLPNEFMSDHKIFEGLTREDAAFRVDLANVLIRGVGLENVFEPSEVKLKRAFDKLLPVFEKHAHCFSEKSMLEFRSDVGYMCDVVAQKLTGISPEEGVFLLCIDSILLQEVPETIVFNHVNVNQPF